MGLLRNHLRSEAAHCREEGVRVSIIGRRDRLDPGLVAAIEAIEAMTRNGTRLHLQLAIDYSGRDALLEAMRLAVASADVIPLHGGRTGGGGSSRWELGDLLARALHAPGVIPDVDLLIRTGGEQRLSDFMLWEAAYAELVFTPRPWPDFSGAELEAALVEFRRRDRRFGGVSNGVAQEVSHG
jgi:undecaprenyl diphosphate synthase